MPTNRKRRPRKRKAACSPELEAKLFDLPKPKDVNPFAWLHDPTEAEWEEHRARVLARWTRTKPGTRPKTWWKFDAPGKRQDHEPQAAFLRRHGLLTEDELERLTPADFEPEKVDRGD
jgi:hypothetical protein